MNKIQLTEGQFNKLVSKCVKKALNEISGKEEGIDYNSFDGTGDGYNTPYSEVIGDGEIYMEVE